jgi:hypothetical protein
MANDRNMTSLLALVLANLPTRRQSIHEWHLYVKKDEVKALSVQQGEGHHRLATSFDECPMFPSIPVLGCTDSRV